LSNRKVTSSQKSRNWESREQKAGTDKEVLLFTFWLTMPAVGGKSPDMHDHAVERVRVRVKRKHTFRRVFQIALGTVLAVGLVYLLLSAFTNQSSSPSPSPAISDDDTAARFR
jgi:hypothetical protein